MSDKKNDINLDNAINGLPDLPDDLQSEEGGSLPQIEGAETLSDIDLDSYIDNFSDEGQIKPLPGTINNSDDELLGAELEEELTEDMLNSVNEVESELPGSNEDVVSELADVIPESEDEIDLELTDSLPAPDDEVDSELADALPESDDGIDSELPDELSAPDDEIDSELPDELPAPDDEIDSELPDELPAPDDEIDSEFPDELPAPDDEIDSELPDELPAPDDEVDSELADKLPDSDDEIDSELPDELPAPDDEVDSELSDELPDSDDEIDSELPDELSAPDDEVDSELSDILPDSDDEIDSELPDELPLSDDDVDSDLLGDVFDEDSSDEGDTIDTSRLDGEEVVPEDEELSEEELDGLMGFDSDDEDEDVISGWVESDNESEDELDDVDDAEDIGDDEEDIIASMTGDIDGDDPYEENLQDNDISSEDDLNKVLDTLVPLDKVSENENLNNKEDFKDPVIDKPVVDVQENRPEPLIREEESKPVKDNSDVSEKAVSKKPMGVVATAILGLFKVSSFIALGLGGGAGYNYLKDSGFIDLPHVATSSNEVVEQLAKKVGLLEKQIVSPSKPQDDLLERYKQLSESQDSLLLEQQKQIALITELKSSVAKQENKAENYESEMIERLESLLSLVVGVAEKQSNQGIEIKESVLREALLTIEKSTTNIEQASIAPFVEQLKKSISRISQLEAAYTAQKTHIALLEGEAEYVKNSMQEIRKKQSEIKKTVESVPSPKVKKETKVKDDFVFIANEEKKDDSILSKYHLIGVHAKGSGRFDIYVQSEKAYHTAEFETFWFSPNQSSVIPNYGRILEVREVKGSSIPYVVVTENGIIRGKR